MVNKQLEWNCYEVFWLIILLTILIISPASIFSTYIRWGANKKVILNGCDSTMSEDEIIDKMFSNAYNRAGND